MQTCPLRCILGITTSENVAAFLYPSTRPHPLRPAGLITMGVGKLLGLYWVGFTLL